MINIHKKLQAYMLTLIIILSSVFAEAQFAITSANLNTRMSPSLNGRKIAVLPKGTQIEIVRREGSWTLIETTTGRRAYVASRYLQNITEAAAQSECADCARPQPRPANLQTENIQQVLDMVNPEPITSFAACISERMVDAAEDRVRREYGGRTRGGGRCALAVRQSLNDAGIWTGAGIGNAKDMMPGLRQMGFRNVMIEGMSPDEAPNGSILVYGSPLRGTRGCRGLGNQYGHVEIKESDSSYIYDGNPSFHIQEAYGPRCRPLIGVMMMGASCPTCTTSTKRTCGA